jgi:predicted transcriptional regulator
VATPKLFPNGTDLSNEQLDLIQRFEADYNAVDHMLRSALGVDKQPSFSYLVTEYSRRHAIWPDAEALRKIAEVRNAIVHGKTEPYDYVAIPTIGIADKLRKSRERLTNPARAIPKFQRVVEMVSTQDTLARVLKVINERDYSQFPVYKGDEFRGLLTENGITRWLAHHVVDTLSLVELDDIYIEDVLRSEEERKNHQFVPRSMLVDDVSASFASEASLEAVLITSNGKHTEKLLGIVTRWDILHLHE